MPDPRPTRHRWSLTQGAFDALLARLDPDRDAAGRRFEQLHHKLLQFFAYEACALPDRWADETLDRLAKRLSEGEPVQDVNAFLRGAAKLVLREAQLAERRERQAIAQLDPPSPAEVQEDAAHLEDCLAQLSPENRALIEQYYSGDAQARIRNRQRLAASLGSNIEALRTRALRIRRQLEQCLFKCREMPRPISPPKSEGRPKK